MVESTRGSMEKFSIFAATQKVLEPILSTEKFNSVFDIFYIESEAEFLKKMESVIPSIIVLDEDFLFKYPDLTEKIQEKTLFLKIGRAHV